MSNQKVNLSSVVTPITTTPERFAGKYISAALMSGINAFEARLPLSQT